MANKRINPQLPSGQVPLSVSRPLPLARPALVDPATERYDTSALAKGLAFFSQKAAERKGEMQEEAALKGREFVKNNPEVFAAAKDDESLERALKNAVKDGVIPRGLLPSFQSGIRKSIAEDRLDSARAKIKEEVIRYSGLDENGEPKDLSQVQEEIASISDRVIGEIPSSLLTDPEFGGKVAGIADNIRLSAQQEAFSKALSDRNDWAVKHAQESFQGVLDEVAGPLSSEEEEGLKAVLNDLTAKFKNRGVEDTDVALTDAIVLHATSLRNQSVEDALFFIESAGKFEVNGRAIGLDPALIQLQARLDEEFLRGDDRARIREQKELQRVQDAILEADGDLVDLRESRDLDGYEAALRATIGELDVDPEIDGRVEILIRDALDRAEAEPDEEVSKLITDIEQGFAAVPENWQESYRDRLSADQYARFAAAVATQQKQSEAREVNNRIVDRRVQAAQSIANTAGFSGAAKSEFEERHAVFEDRLRSGIDQRRLELARRGLSPDEIENEIDQYMDSALAAYDTNIERLAVEMRNLNRQEADIFELSNTPTSANLSAAQENLNEIRASLTPQKAEAAERQIKEAQFQVRQIRQSLTVREGNEFYQNTQNSLFQLLSDEEGNMDPAALATLNTVFQETSSKENFDSFIETVQEKYGFVSTETAQAEIRDRVVKAFNLEEGVSIAEAAQKAQALKSYMTSLSGEHSRIGRTKIFVDNETNLTAESGRWVFDNMWVNRSKGAINSLIALPENEAATALMAVSGTINDVLFGSVALRDMNGNEVRRYELGDLDIEYRMFPLANSVRGLLRDLNSMDIDDRGALMETLGYLQQADSEESIREATQKFINDQTTLIGIRTVRP